jgi:hypothetical protein
MHSHTCPLDLRAMQYIMGQDLSLPSRHSRTKEFKYIPDFILYY